MYIKPHIIYLLQSLGFSYDAAYSIYEQYETDNKTESLYDYVQTKLSLYNENHIESIPLRDM